MIATIGDINVDLIARIDRIPATGKQVVTRDLQMHGGGCSANFSLSCSRLGMGTQLFGKVGDDVFGRYVLLELEDNGVDTANVLLTDKRTGMTFAMVQGIERSFITYQGENATLCLDDIDISRISADIVHLPSYFLMDSLRHDYIKLIDLIHAAGIKVSFDTGWDPRGFIEETVGPLREILPKVDLFMPNMDEARNILKLGGDAGPEKAAGMLVGMGVKTAVVKVGEGGCWIADRNTSEYVPAFKVDVVDTTGAGDNFAAGFISAYISGRTLRESAVIGSATAALKIGGVGWPAYPERRQVNKFLSDRGFEGF
ncbi:carbohydrate kinase family protein [Methanocella paludicola]|nr:carbohydrate kinase family protein [Methanocella paludicola]